MKRALLALLVAFQSGAAEAAGGAFDFFEEEARVVTASFLPKTPAHAPATVRVVTAEDIKASGAQTVWDALRGVPGVEVAQLRAFQAEVGVRGLNGPLNNRVLVLLDGKTAMNAAFDVINWESIPVTMEEIARIEIVEGPASALYGANAVAGVINIITKTPEQLGGGLVTMSAGEGRLRSGSALYGARKGRLDYKVGLGARAGGGFEDAGLQATRVGKAHALVGFDFSPERRLSFSGGLVKTNTQVTTGSPGTAFVDGVSGFLRSDYRVNRTQFSAFWNRERSVYKELAALGDPPNDFDAWDLSARRSWRLPGEMTLVAGGSARRNSVRSRILEGGGAQQDLWALFVEGQWEPHEAWTFVAGGRVDRNPLTPLAFSPRGSVIYEPSESHVLRLSAGTSFRNPTMLEAFLDVTLNTANPPGGDLPNPPFTGIRARTSGSSSLSPEKMFQAEVSHTGRFGPVQTTATAFYYTLNNLIQATDPVVVSAVPPTANVTTSFGNSGGTRAVGLEAGAEAGLRPGLLAFVNYSYQSVRADEAANEGLARLAPRHKANAGLRGRRGGLSGGLWAHWVDKTYWNQNSLGTAPSYAAVPSYLLLNGRLGYAFAGAWDGWEVGLGAFNLGRRSHHEGLPALGPRPGANAERVGSRWTGTVSYRFR